MDKLTFVQSMNAWKDAMHNKDRTKLDELLSEDFIWENIAMEGKSSKEETIQFSLKIKDEVPSFRIGECQSLFESDEILVGSHGVHQDDRDDTIVLCVVNLCENGSKIKMWRHLRGESLK